MPADVRTDRHVRMDPMVSALRRHIGSHVGCRRARPHRSQRVRLGGDPHADDGGHGRERRRERPRRCGHAPGGHGGRTGRDQAFRGDRAHGRDRRDDLPRARPHRRGGRPEGIGERRRHDLDGVRRPRRGAEPSHRRGSSREQRVPRLRGRRCGRATPPRAGTARRDRRAATSAGRGQAPPRAPDRPQRGDRGGREPRSSTSRVPRPERRDSSPAARGLASEKGFLRPRGRMEGRRPATGATGETRGVRTRRDDIGTRRRAHVARDGRRSPRLLLAPVARRDRRGRRESPSPHRPDPPREPPPPRGDPRRRGRGRAGARAVAAAVGRRRVHAGSRPDAGLHRRPGGRRPGGDAQRRRARRRGPGHGQSARPRGPDHRPLGPGRPLPVPGRLRGQHRLGVPPER